MLKYFAPLILLSLFITTHVEGYFNQFALKGGATFGGSHLTVATHKINPNGQQAEEVGEAEDEFPIVGVVTFYGYRFVKWEFGIFSNSFIGMINDVEFLTHNSVVRGKGTFRNFSIGPFVKYLTDIRPNKSYNWNLFFGLAPLWGIETIYLSSFQTAKGSFDKKHKIIYTSTGFSLSMGLEEMLPLKDSLPMFLELQYSYLRPVDISLVDSSDVYNPRLISSESTFRGTRIQSIMLNLGFTIF